MEDRKRRFDDKTEVRGRMARLEALPSRADLLRCAKLLSVRLLRLVSVLRTASKILDFSMSGLASVEAAHTIARYSAETISVFLKSSPLNSRGSPLVLASA
jgi:hypothetical protein